MKEMILIKFPKEESGHAVVYNLIKEHDLIVNIIRASIDYNAEGFMLVELEGAQAQLDKGLGYLKDINVEVTVVDAGISINENKCFNCGACTAVCAVDALYLDNQSKLYFDKDLCLDCKLCVTACPARAIETVL